MEADHFVSKFGADIELWVASVDWETEFHLKDFLRTAVLAD